MKITIFEHISRDDARMRRHDEEVRIFSRDVLEHLHLSQLGTAICGSAMGKWTRCGKSDQQGVQSYDRRVFVSEREERVGGDHGSFDVGLRRENLDEPYMRRGRR